MKKKKKTFQIILERKKKEYMKCNEKIVKVMRKFQMFNFSNNKIKI